MSTSSYVSAPIRKASYSIDATQLNASTKSVKYFIEDTTPTQITEFFTVNVVAECGDEVVIYWQNHWGEFDTYFFAGNNTQSTKTKSKTINNRLTQSYNSYDRGERDIKKFNTREFEVFTRTEKPEVIEWLSEIGESVDVFVMDGTDRVPINVKSVQSKIYNDAEGIFQFSLKYTMSNKRINQIG